MAEDWLSGFTPEGPGLFTFVVGDDEAKIWLEQGGRRVDDFLYEVTDATAAEFGDRLGVNAPGSIKELVEFIPAMPGEPGVITAEAGVVPDVSKENMGNPAGHRSSFKGLGSDPADYPIYVDQGTGVYGKYHKEITSIPGHVMAWKDQSYSNSGSFESEDWVFARSVKGQEGQFFGELSYAETVGWVPARLQIARRAFGGLD